MYIEIYLSAQVRVPPPLFYSWRFVAVAVASKNGIRRLRFRFWEGSLGTFLASSLTVLCISCKFLASSVQVLSASFLRNFLLALCRSSARAAESAGKLDHK